MISPLEEKTKAQLTGKVAVVTGGATGIGRAAAVRFAREGAKVVYTVNRQAGKSTAQEIAEAGGEAIEIKTDVSNPRDVEDLMKMAVDTYGKIDILVSNAGLMSEHKPVGDVPLEYWDRVISVNLKGCFLCAKYALPHMIKNGAGSIVTVASISGLVAFPGEPAYGASKGGIIQLTRSLAIDYADRNIRANCLAVGIIDNDMTRREMELDGDPTEIRHELAKKQPVGRMGTNEEVAAAALFLASDEASFITGATLVVDGGLVASA